MQGSNLREKRGQANVSYDGDVRNYASYLQRQIKGICCYEGTLSLPGNGKKEQLPCVSIDNIVGLPNGYSASVVPRRFHGEYYTDFILYAPGDGEDKFRANGKGPGRARVEFGNHTRDSIYDILIKGGMQDLTLKPVPVKKGWGMVLNEHEVLEMGKRVKRRYLGNLDNLWIYYTSTFAGTKNNPAFVVHLPEDPMQAAQKMRDWFGAFKRLRANK